VLDRPSADDLDRPTRSSPSSTAAQADIATPCPVPIRWVESKIEMATSGRISMFREWRRSGLEIHRNARWRSWANHTGELHGTPLPSAVARTM
jgi:hypothetical protein